MYRFAHIWIQVHRINEVHLRVFFCQVFDSSTHMDESVTEVFTTMSRNQHQLLTTIQTAHVISGFCQYPYQFTIQRLVALNFIHYPIKRINYRIPGHDDIPIVNTFPYQIATTQWSRREMVGRQSSGQKSIHLLRPWAIDVMCT